MNRFAIGCLHLGHHKVLQYENRPFDNVETMAAVIAMNWAKTVDRDATVYVLGDVSLYRDRAYVKAYFEGLPGKKIIILGNHDRWGKASWLQCGFSEVYKQLSIGHVTLTHRPIDKPMPEGHINIHAHIHSSLHGYPWGINASVEAIDYTPYNFTELI